MNLRNFAFVFLLFINLFPAKAKVISVYKSHVVSGFHQDIGTLSPINRETLTTAEEAVILIPGLNGVTLRQDLYEWKYFWESWLKYPVDQEVKKKYLMIVFRYDGWDSLFESAETVSRGIQEILEEHPNIKRISFIGYSQGGVIPRIVLDKHPEIDSITRKVITTAAPHHGTPTLTTKLLRDVFNNQNPLVGIKNTKALNLFVGRYRHAYKEQAWDNFDNGLPPSAKYEVPPQALTIPAPQSTEKFIVYGSYVFPPSAKDAVDYIHYFFGEILPRTFLDRRSGMKELNRWMANKVYEDEEPKLRDSLRLNDGVTPLSSAIWARMCGINEPQPQEWKNIFPTNNYCPLTGNQRVFYGMDHLMWRQDINERKPMADLLHPCEKEKPVYDWIIEDLLSKG
jgi:hypothetical protein